MDAPPPYFARTSLATQEAETASIRSAAPSYISDALTYVSTIPSPATSASSRTNSLRSSYQSSLSPPYFRNPNLHPRANSTPSLDAFRMPAWSRTQASNPTARHYHSVAIRRASALTIQEQSTLLVAALNGEDGIAQIKKRMEDEEREREMRTNEDPYLVGEEAAEANRQERLKRENGWNVLEKEDKRWDWLLGMYFTRSP